MHTELVKSQNQADKAGAAEDETIAMPETSDSPQNNEKSESDIARLVSVIEIIKREFLNSKADGQGLYQYNELGSLDSLRRDSHSEPTATSFTNNL